MNNNKLVFVVNVDWFFLSHRLPIAVAAIEEGYEVHLICKVTGSIKDISSLGIIVHDVPFSRGGTRLHDELRNLYFLNKALKSIQPDIIHAVTIKPIIYTGLLIHFLSYKPKFVAAISGLGYIYSAKNLKAKILKFLTSFLYRIAFLHKSKVVIFQNSTDEKTLTKIANLTNEQKILIGGSGADLEVYRYTEEPCDESIKVVMACRLLKEKGVYEFVKAADLIQKSINNVEFLLAGTPDSENPNSVTLSELKTWDKNGVIKYLGHCDNIPKLFSDSHIVTMPSYYGEGVPKVLIEASACGRPIVTTDNPGCRDSILPEITGLLIPVKDSYALATAITRLINNKRLRIEMGLNAREFSVRSFDLKNVIAKHLSIYENLSRDS